MLYSPALDLAGPNIETIVGVTRENAIDKIGGPGNVIHALLVYGLCPLPVFPDHIYHWVSLYHSTDGTRRMGAPADYYALPALWVDICQAIDAERARLAKAHKGKEITRVSYGNGE